MGKGVAEDKRGGARGWISINKEWKMKELARRINAFFFFFLVEP